MRAVAVGAQSIKISYAPPTAGSRRIAPAGRGRGGRSVRRARLRIGRQSARGIQCAPDLRRIPGCRRPAHRRACPHSADDTAIPGSRLAARRRTRPRQPPATAPPLLRLRRLRPQADGAVSAFRATRRLTPPRAKLSPSRLWPITPPIWAPRRWSSVRSEDSETERCRGGRSAGPRRRRAVLDEEYSERSRERHGSGFPATRIEGRDR